MILTKKKSERNIVIQIIWLLLIVALLLNVDRLVLGKSGALQHVDVADQYIDKFAYGGKFWQTPSKYSWDASILRGWPTLLGSVSPQHLGCLLSTVLPIQYVMPFLIIITEMLILVGSFLFLYSILGYGLKTALYGAILNLTIYFWYNENPYNVQIILLPTLCAFLYLRKNYIPTIYKYLVLLLIILLSYPPYTLPIMPIAHILLILFVYRRQDRLANLKFAALFWLLYIIFYAPNIIGYLQNWRFSNRSQWSAGFVEGMSLEKSLVLFLTSGTAIFPALVVLALLSKANFKKALSGMGILLGIIIFTAINQSSFWNKITTYLPQIKTFSFIYARLYNFVGFIIFMLGAYLIESYFHRQDRSFKKQLYRFLIIILVLTALLKYSQWWRLVIFYIFLALLSATLILFDLFRSPQKTGLVFITAFLFLVPFRLISTYCYEGPAYSNLFCDKAAYNTDIYPYRVVTIFSMGGYNLSYPAQASIRNIETLDGVSVFYSAQHAKRWLWYIKDVKNPYSAMFKSWNNRVELYCDDL